MISEANLIQSSGAKSEESFGSSHSRTSKDGISGCWISGNDDNAAKRKPLCGFKNPPAPTVIPIVPPVKIMRTLRDLPPVRPMAVSIVGVAFPVKFDNGCGRFETGEPVEPDPDGVDIGSGNMDGLEMGVGAGTKLGRCWFKVLVVD